MLCIEDQLSFVYSPFVTKKSSFSNREGNTVGFAAFWSLLFSFERFLSLLNCRHCSTSKVIAFALSFSSTMTTNVAGFCLFNARCAYVTAFLILFMLLSLSHWKIAFVSSACFMKTDEGMLSSSKANIGFIWSGHSRSGCFNHAVSVSHSILLGSSIMVALAPISAELLIPLTYLHCEKSFVHNISATRLPRNTCYLRWKLCIHLNTVVDWQGKCDFYFPFPWLSVFSTSMRCLTLAIPITVLKDVSSLLLSFFQWQL